MTYSDKREFAARVFEMVKRVAEYDARPQEALLAQAQLDALPNAERAAKCDEDGPLRHSAANPGNLHLIDGIDAAYALALQLAPLVGVEVME